MKATFLLSISITALFSTFAQAQSADPATSSPKSERTFMTKNITSDKTPGSQYFNDAFVPAKIGDSNELYLVRYNAYTDEIEVNVKNVVKIVPSESNLTIRIANTPFSYDFVEYTNAKDAKKTGYLKAISNNQKIKIYKSESIFLKDAVDPDSYGTYKPATYTKLKDEYFIKIGDSEIKPLPLKKKNIIAILPSKEKEIAAFIKENDLSISEEADLITLGRYINSLM